MPLAEETENVLTAHGIWVEMVLLVAFTAGLLWYYRAKEVPWLVAGCVFISWLLGFMGTLLLPADIVLTLLNGQHRLPHHITITMFITVAAVLASCAWITRVWYALYWTTFALAWLVIPTLLQSWQAGELTWPERLKAALCLNVRQYLMMLLALVLFTAYLVSSEQVSVGRVSGFLMTLANTYGLLFIILLLGQGLVEVPRQLWLTSFPDRELQRLYFTATQVDADLQDANYELEEVERNLDSLERAIEVKQGWHVRDRAHLRQLLAAARKTEEIFHSEIDDGSFRSARFTGKNRGQRWDEGRTAAEAFKELGVSTLSAKDASRIHSELRAAQMKVVASKMRWEALLRETDALLCILDNNIPWGPAICSSTPGATFRENLLEMGRRLGRRSGWLWRLYLRSYVCKAMAMLCSILSALILWSEVVVASWWNLSPFGILLRAMDPKEAGVAHAISLQAAVLVPFLYMSVCCYRSLFTLRVFGAFTLQGNQRSLPGPLLFNAQYLIRLQFPLGYNFLGILRYYPMDTSRVSPLELPAFQSLMNNMRLVPVLGTSFNVYAPMVLVVLCLFTFFRGYARVLRLVGLEHEDLVSLDDPDGKERLEEGKSLVERGKRHAHLVFLRRQGQAQAAESPQSAPSKGRPNGSSAGYVAPTVAYSKIQDSGHELDGDC